MAFQCRRVAIGHHFGVSQSDEKKSEYDGSPIERAQAAFKNPPSAERVFQKPRTLSVEEGRRIFREMKANLGEKRRFGRISDIGYRTQLAMFTFIYLPPEER